MKRLILSGIAALSIYSNAVVAQCIHGVLPRIDPAIIKNVQDDYKNQKEPNVSREGQTVYKIHKKYADIDNDSILDKVSLVNIENMPAYPYERFHIVYNKGIEENKFEDKYVVLFKLNGRALGFSLYDHDGNGIKDLQILDDCSYAPDRAIWFVKGFVENNRYKTPDFGSLDIYVKIFVDEKDKY